MQELFDESTYKLDEDFLIGMFKNDGNITYMAIGMNNLMVEEDYVTYEIKKFESFSMGFNGLCYSIVPNNVMLKPGTNFYFFIESSIVDKKDQIKGIDLMFSTENTYFATSKCQ